MNDREYLEELRGRLSYRGASRRRANDILAEVQSHLADSGEDPVEAFGTPDWYAERVLRGPRWPTARGMAFMVLAVAGGGLTAKAVSGWTDGEAVVSVRATDLSFWLVFVLVVPLGMLPVVARRFPRLGTQMAIVAPVAVLATCAASYLAWDVLDDRTLASMSTGVALAVGLGLLAAASAVALVTHLLRR